MPKNTNPFQQLVALIQTALAPKGAVVTESALTDLSGREIDILIETDIGPYRIKIAVEAKDEGRKMDSTKFESILGKYLVEGGVKVNKIVVITHHGFYEPVIERAKNLEIDLFTLEQATSADWSSLYPKQLHFRFLPHICQIEIEPGIQPAIQADVFREGVVFCSHGTNHGTLLNFITSFLVPMVLKQQPSLISDLERVAQGSTGEAKAKIDHVPNHAHSIHFREQSYRISKLKFQIHMINDVGDVKYTTCQLTSPEGVVTNIPHAEVEVGGMRLQMVMPEGMKSEKITVRFDAIKKNL